ncbi:hypothetical protein QYS48_32845 [Marivirga arenosa]|uniref:Carboxypeptidase-like regulatory domain-containing protein n=1 Tax=Marivirga arenosa TaxID=3059076 RepID=A0AA51N8N8_9BACT|nr:hypothetical protein [Marivirga sp. ABR2-2]WMN06555.1 hypothetical protein QYS48_32845 [Marivirga sp. ABR2-2]
MAQKPVVIKGIVSNSENEFLMGATIMLYSVNDTIKVIDYSIADENGKFSFDLKEKPTEKLLKISYLGYQKKKVIITEDQFFYNIILQKSTQTLREVTVDASAIRDTVNLVYDTTKFSKNSKLKELLRDNEGIEVTDENALKYMGVPINKILINKKEVFVNQNSIALDNITNEMIKDIQIINNYKDKFNVDFDNFNELVLNVNVKNKFKGALKNIIELGLGIEKAYLLEGNSFLFSDKLNVFLTQNINSIIEKNNNTNEIKNRQNNTSSFYSENVSSISKGLNEVRSDKYNNTYLLVKKEYDNLKIQANIGFNNSNQDLQNRILIDNNQNPVSEEITNNNRKGNLVYTDIFLTTLISKDFSLSIYSNIDRVDNQLIWNNEKSIFPSLNFESNTLFNSNNFIYTTGINTKKIFNKVWLWENTLEHTKEDTDNTFTNDLGEVSQSIDFTKKSSNFSSSLFYQKSNLFNIGFNINLKNNEDRIFSFINTSSQLLYRNYYNVKGALIVKGQNSKSNYFLNIGPESIFFKDYQYSRLIYPISTSFNHKFSGRKSISLSYENNYLLENLQNSLDSLYINFTSLETANISERNIQQSQNLTLDYNIANISKSLNVSFLAGGSIDNNFTQANLFDFNSNINVYNRMIFDERESFILKHRYSKGFYFTRKDHKIQFGYELSSTFSNNQIAQENIIYPFSTEKYDAKLNLFFIPQDLFFSEVSLLTNLSNNIIKINQNKVNSIEYNKNTLAISKAQGNHIYSAFFYNEVFKSETETIRRNDLDLKYQYTFNESISIFTKGIAILNLLNINNTAGNLSTNSISGLNITTINTNTFGYIITGVQLKF